MTALIVQRLVGPWDVCPVSLTALSDAIPQLPPDADPAWRTVPECAHLQPVLYPDQPYWGDHLRPINDQAWVYRQRFPTPATATPFRRARLKFEGVDYYAAVWLNGQPIGTHEGHFAPFTFEVTAHLRPPGAVNELLVRVWSPWDAPNPKGTYPTDHVLRGMVKGLYEHGEGVIPPHVNPLGIWRPAWLLLDAGLSIDRVRIRTDLDGNAALTLTLTSTLDTPWQGTLALVIAAENHTGSGAEVTIPVTLVSGTQTITHTLSVADVRLWWSWDHGDPHLYRLRASLLDAAGTQLSAITDLFGFRTITLERTPERFTYILNGRPIAMRGTSYMPGLYLSQCDEAGFERDLALAMAAHLNLLRVHVHVSPPELYTLCDRLGMLIWQDFELNWTHDASLAFEARARVLQREMIDLLGNHPSIITWSSHNEPTNVFSRRHNLEQHPDPALYADALAQDPTRPVFLCSGQMAHDWQCSGDSHTYYGAIWSDHYTDIYRVHTRLSTEFGFEAPAAAATLRAYPFAWQRLQHLADGDQIATAWAYQADLTQYHIEHFRRLRATGCAGYIHFWLVDLVPQVGCGVLDAHRQPKGGYEALRRASQPVLVALEHDGRRPLALWVFNDTMQAYPQAMVSWRVMDAAGDEVFAGQTPCELAANQSRRVLPVNWTVDAARWVTLELTLTAQDGRLLSTNQYHAPFQRKRRPAGYPWNFDFDLGTKVFDRQDAPSLVAVSNNWAINLIPIRLREMGVEWVLRQQLPPWLVWRLAKVFDRFG